MKHECLPAIVLGVLVILFAWVPTGYNNIILTVLGILVILASFKTCDQCKVIMEGKKKK